MATTPTLVYTTENKPIIKSSHIVDFIDENFEGKVKL